MQGVQWARLQQRLREVLAADLIHHGGRQIWPLGPSLHRAKLISISIFSRPYMQIQKVYQHDFPEARIDIRVKAAEGHYPWQDIFNKL